MTTNPHFQTPGSWTEAAELLAFEPVVPAYTAGCELQSLAVHVRDHRSRELPEAERSLEAHYGRFMVSQARPGSRTARRGALDVSYGASPRDALVAGHEGRAYELGPEPPPEDTDGRPPSVVVWSDAEMLYLVASDQLQASELERIAGSLYE